MMRLLTVGLTSLVGTLAHAVDYSENSAPDISGDHTAPLILVVDEGLNTVTANVVLGDQDFFTLRVPAGLEITEINLFSYFHPAFGNSSFFGYQDGSTLDQAPADLEIGEITYALIGQNEVGPSLLPFLNVAPAGSVPPLGPGDYSFWLNETDGQTAFLSLGFTAVAIPEPSTGVLLLLGAGLLARRRFNRN